MTASLTRSELLRDLVDANRILFHQGIVDAFGHVSGRDPERADRFWMARNVAPGLVEEHDLLEFDVDSGEPTALDAPRVYLERFIHSEIYRHRPDVHAVVHSHSPCVLPFAIARGARLRPVCHMSGFLGEGPPLFEIRQHAGDDSDLLIRDRTLGRAVALSLGAHAVVLMRGHGATAVAPSVRVAVYRAIYTEVNAKVLLQTLPLGEPVYLTEAECRSTQATNESQVERPWNLWRRLARPQPQAE